jgi:hypothetical protein
MNSINEAILFIETFVLFYSLIMLQQNIALGIVFSEVIGAIPVL